MSHSQQYDYFYDEMMAHAAIFTYQRPSTVAIVGEADGVLKEVLKHPSIEQITYVQEKNHTPNFNKQVTQITASPKQWLAGCGKQQFDLMLFNEPVSAVDAQSIASALTADGMLAQPGFTAWLDASATRAAFYALHEAGFLQCRLLHFFQPDYPTGLRTILLATKHPVFKRLRESDIFNRPFSTRYYNFDTHKAALALPEFMREEIEEI